MDIEMKKLLVSRGLRVTTPRKAVFETLQTSSAPLSQTEIAGANPDIDRTSVYRTIEAFLKLGIVTGVAHGWKQRYELATPFRPHHHHFLCTQCGEVEEIQSEKLEQAISALAQQRGFKVASHTFEVTGLCSTCRGLKQ